MRCAVGAREIRAVVLERVIDSHVHGGCDHVGALRAVRHVQPYLWSPERA